MKKIVVILLLAAVCLSAGYQAAAQLIPEGVILRVVIIRHGEKPAQGDNLSCQGLNRALALPAVLDTVTGKPDFTYVPELKTGGTKTSSVRMFQTVTPFAVQQNLVINSQFKENDTSNAAKDVRTRTGMVLMVWEHGNIPGLARQLGVKGNLSWKGTDFDSIWIIDFSKKDKKGKAKDPVLTIEQENITPSVTCPGS
jgi:hypothetical protein